MPLVSDLSLILAIKNIYTHGDTDIFPFPIENHLFHDKPNEVLGVLREIDRDFEGAISKIPVLTSKELAAVGYSGFRLGTQIDPLWNAYLLGLIIEIGPDIEKKRVNTTTVFSYRFMPDEPIGTIFNKGIGWHQFQETIKATTENYPFVLRCDISDFYPRIYHHRLENALNMAAVNQPEISRRIMALIKAISDGPSYGLPVGGAAARLLSEILLNRVDRLLISENIKFCRFVDDFVIFSKSREEAQSSLITLTKLLLTNEGLSLQKAKTRVMTAAEYLATSDFSEPPENESPEDERARTFRRLRIHFDPYSPTAEEDYKALASELSKFDIVGMLGRELAKSRIDEGLTRRLVGAIKLLNPNQQNDAIRSMLASLDLLYPIFPSVMQLCRFLLPNLDPTVKELLFKSLRELITSNSYITQVPANLAFALKVLSTDFSEEMELLLANLYKQSSSMMIKRDIILLMANRSADHWVSNCRTTFSTVTAWEKRALMIASYMLGDEGKHWRESIKKEQNNFDQLVMQWIGEMKSKKGTGWKLPI
ncbi:RNA-directed DNA polymerase [Polynucleobacter sp. AP-Nino-20-G2]|uniref:RNA-directed DNA polymerase n=1 Tax=Polynucleobacter sp. AP-Nino-20-G2 TaxID=2576917 RepID=UPI001BFD3504|nr:RNA-directed DNA polymerase [Polynucleobacter sp. AP-Nino-20-G2]QWE17167.1 RNA-directed DNA polymerase [Polynucleobacter sp. AP-Nino-20-G2]